MKPNLYQEKKLQKKGYKRIAGLDEAGRGCERSDAEILTNNGWKFYPDINLNDEVLSYTNEGYLKWQRIEKVIEKNFEGNLIELKNRGINIVVTPDHYFTVIRRISKRDKKDNNKLKLVGYNTVLYINDESFMQCKRLVLSILREEMDQYSQLDSIDEVAEIYDHSIYDHIVLREGEDPEVENDEDFSLLSPEGEFWGHGSNIEVWAEHAPLQFLENKPGVP